MYLKEIKLFCSTRKSSVPANRVASSRVRAFCVFASSLHVGASCARIRKVSLQSGQDPPSASSLRCKKRTRSILTVKGFALEEKAQRLYHRTYNSSILRPLILNFSPCALSLWGVSMFPGGDLSHRSNDHCLFPFQGSFPEADRINYVVITVLRTRKAPIMNLYPFTPAPRIHHSLGLLIGTSL